MDIEENEFDSVECLNLVQNEWNFVKTTITLLIKK
jgi:hypothetical protein